MAGCGSYSKVEGFVFLPITAFAMALTTFIGQNLGAVQTMWNSAAGKLRKSKITTDCTMRIGVDLGGTNVRAGLVKDGRIVRLLSEPCKADRPEGEVVDQIASLIGKLITESLLRRWRL